MHRRSRQHLEIDVAAFADVAFLLIIFFILTTTFVKPAGNKLDIPSGAPDPEKKHAKQLTITLTANDINYGPQGEEMTLEELRAALFSENFPAKPPDKRIVILESAPDVPYERYFQVVMTIANADGVLALIEEEEGP
jgi:biopolymer transport protein ExbD